MAKISVEWRFFSKFSKMHEKWKKDCRKDSCEALSVRVTSVAGNAPKSGARPIRARENLKWTNHCGGAKAPNAESKKTQCGNYVETQKTCENWKWGGEKDQKRARRTAKSQVTSERLFLNMKYTWPRYFIKMTKVSQTQYRVISSEC